jgi:hypothetical protein
VSIVETSFGGPYYGADLDPGTYAIQYMATDAAGNTAECDFTIVVEDNDDPYLVCQSDMEVAADPGACTWLVSTGELDPLFVRDNCPGDELSYEIGGQTTASGVGVVDGVEFNEGTSTVTYTLEDASGNRISCSFDVSVLDEEAPVVSCPLDIAENVDAGECNFTDAPTLEVGNASDNCSAFGDLTIRYRVEGPDNSLSGPFANGTDFDFAVGISQVEYTVMDESGNVSSCIQFVEIRDEELPTIDCANLAASYDTDAGMCGYTVQGAEFDPVFDDNCGVTRVVNDYNSGRQK